MESRRCWERRGDDNAGRGRTTMAATIQRDGEAQQTLVTAMTANESRDAASTIQCDGDAKRQATSRRDGDTRSGGVILRFVTNNGDEQMREFQSGGTARQP
ncbi:hypothetical protein U1Q18_009644 [Sarracenia purpurea var. burkii]